MRHLLVIDQSTSATKVVLLDALGTVIDKASRPHRQYFPRPGFVEHDADEIWQALKEAARELLTRRASLANSIDSVSITNQRESFVVIERGSGKPLHRVIVWQCRRGDELCAEQRRAGADDLVRARTGLRIDGYFSAPKMQWVMRENAQLARRLRAGDAMFATLDAFLIYRLNSRQTFATDPTNASRTLLFDIDRLRWDETLCALWEIPKGALPEVRGSEACFGETSLEGLLPQPVPIRGVMGDSQAAMFAQQCFLPGTAKVTLGTGASLLMNVGSRRGQSQRVVTSLAWERGGECTYALEGMVNSAAASLSWLRDQMGIIACNEEAEFLARDTPSDGVYLVPAFSGLGAPYWSDSARAAIVGLSAHSDRRHIARAAIEAIAFQVCDLYELLQAEAAAEITELCCDGGLTRNSLLMQTCADLMGIELRVSGNPDGSARGVGMMGALGLGIYDCLQSLPKQAVARVYRRNIAEQEAVLRRNGWRRAVTQVLRSARNGNAERGESEHESVSDHHNLRNGEPAAGARSRRL